MSETDGSTREVPSTVTRVVLVPISSVSVERFADEWEVSVQDDGRTLKLFAKGDGREAERQHRNKLKQEMRDMLRRLSQRV